MYGDPESTETGTIDLLFIMADSSAMKVERTSWVRGRGR